MWQSIAINVHGRKRAITTHATDVLVSKGTKYAKTPNTAIKKTADAARVGSVLKKKPQGRIGFPEILL
jgi:hypothetical protein